MNRKKVAIVSIIAVIGIVLMIVYFNNSHFISSESKECIECHSENHVMTAQMEEWRKSSHAEKGVGCYECHKAEKDDADGFDCGGYRVSVLVTPKDCAACHQKEYEEFDKSHHATAGMILGSLDNYLGEVVEGAGASIQGCQNCHGTLVEIDTNGKPTSDTWPNLGVGRLNPDGSKGNCTACHGRHAFSMKVARSPDSCGKCHMGPDHPQKEIYEESKHGIHYKAHVDEMNLDGEDWLLGEHYTQAPNCVTCHMGGGVNFERTHDLGSRLSLNLRAKVSKPTVNSASKRAEMKKVCSSCHMPAWVDGFYAQLDKTVDLYNENFGRPALEIMKILKENGNLSKAAFDEELEWVYFELWHHEGRRARHGAAMMGPDYVQWHGFYEIAKHFYFKFLPKAKKLGASAYIDKLLKKDDHKWIKGFKPESIELQKAAFKAWGELQDKYQAEMAKAKEEQKQ